jgi:type I restriction enzyme S subunit
MTGVEELLSHLGRLGDVPRAVEKIRELILALAVRGKLASQATSDGSAVEALRLARKRFPATAEALGLRWKASEVNDADDALPRLPEGWVRATVNDTGLYVNGLAFKPSDWGTEGIPIIRIQNLTDETKPFNYAKGKYPSAVMVRTGDILVSWSATLDAFIWNGGAAVLNQHIFRVIPAADFVTPQYLYLVLRYAIREMADSEHAHGLVMTHINRGPFLSTVVMVPPVPEQHRVVEKFDELMALCDSYSSALALRDAARSELLAALFARALAEVE